MRCCYMVNDIRHSWRFPLALGAEGVKRKGEAEAPPHNPLGIRQAQYLTALGWCKDSNNIATSSYLVVL